MMAKEKKKVPNLRFKGFTNDWEQRKLGEVILDYKRKNNNDRLPVLTSSFQGIEYQEKHFGSQQKHDTSDYNVLPKEYMTYRNRSDNGYFRFNINNLGVTGIVSKFYPVFTTINTNKLFLASYINHNHRLKNHFKVVSVGTSQHVLSLRNFKKTNLLFPSKDEQDQIGKFFNLLNRAITLQQRKLELLKQLKKGFLQKLFADKDSKQPVLRFKGFHDDWEQRKLGELYSYHNGKAHEQNQRSSGKYELINLNSISVDGTLKSSGRYINHADEILRQNDLVMILSDIAHGTLLGRVAIIPQDNKYVLNQRVALLRPISKSENSNFMAPLINNNQRYFHKMGIGTSQLNISKSTVIESLWQIPKIKEQSVIGNFLQNIDHIIALQHQKLAKYQSIKKSLLQQMFM